MGSKTEMELIMRMKKTTQEECISRHPAQRKALTQTPVKILNMISPTALPGLKTAVSELVPSCGFLSASYEVFRQLDN